MGYKNKAIGDYFEENMIQDDKLIKLCGRDIFDRIRNELLCGDISWLMFVDCFKKVEKTKNGIRINHIELTKQEIEYSDDSNMKIFGKYEWVYQYPGGGITGDMYGGKIVWKYKNMYLLFDYSC